jgi:hypothetical protein
MPGIELYFHSNSVHSLGIVLTKFCAFWKLEGKICIWWGHIVLLILTLGTRWRLVVGLTFDHFTSSKRTFGTN